MKENKPKFIKVSYKLKDGRSAELVGKFIRNNGKKIIFQSFKKVVWSIGGKAYDQVSFALSEVKIAFKRLKRISEDKFLTQTFIVMTMDVSLKSP